MNHRSLVIGPPSMQNIHNRHTWAYSSPTAVSSAGTDRMKLLLPVISTQQYTHLRARHIRQKTAPLGTRQHRVATCSVTVGADAAGVQQVEKPGLVDELRQVAMAMHTRDQAPKEGKQASQEKWSEVQYYRDGYLQYLAESREVFAALETAVQKFPQYEGLRQSGLERAAALEKDIAWFEQQYGLKPAAITDSSPGRVYARHLLELAEKDTPAFLCHFYNTYFAHSAGGKMIGTKLSAVLLDRHKLQFYQYEGGERGDKPLLQRLVGKINELGESLTADERAHCAAQTKDVFQYAGSLLGLTRKNLAAEVTH